MRSARARPLFVAIVGVLSCRSTIRAQETLTIGGQPYRKAATRAETQSAMQRAITGVGVEWGAWELLGPLDRPGGSKRTLEPLAPERDFDRMAFGGSGPIRGLDYVGKRDRPVRWHPLPPGPATGGSDGFGSIDFKALFVDELGDAAATMWDEAAVYLHRTLVTRSAMKVRVACGSDDGLCLWLDGILLAHSEVERALEPMQHELELDLGAGVNHLVAKITQDRGGWGFQLAPMNRIDRAGQAALDWQLDLDFPEGEARFYRRATLAAPEETSLEVGGLDFLPDGRPAICTRRGDVFLVDGAYALPPAPPRLQLFASGLHEPLGLSVRPDPRGAGGVALVLAQRGELTRLVDLDGDGAADLYETVCDGWSVSGNYHEFAFGPAYDPDGNAWVTLNLAHTDGVTVMGATVDWRGCAVRIHPDGTLERAADGLRSPDGIGWLPGLGLFYTDNQGDYVATNKLSPLRVGSFHGHQASLRFRPGRKDDDAVPPIEPPCVWFPYGKLGQSACGFARDETGGRFGPFTGQIFVGDQTYASVMRVDLETVDGELQGACFPFRSGLSSGAHRLAFAPDGSLFVGLTDRGWTSRGGRRDGLERLVFGGETPFEILTVHAAPGGFDVAFTQDVDRASACAASSWQLKSWRYEYHPQYGSPEMDVAEAPITSVALLDARRVHLSIEGLRAGFVHEVTASGVRSSEGKPLLHDVGWYTLNRTARPERTDRVAPESTRVR